MSVITFSAGVGRTGTYIALDILTEQGKAERFVNVLNCVENLRRQRINMVQTVVSANRDGMFFFLASITTHYCNHTRCVIYISDHYQKSFNFRSTA